MGFQSSINNLLGTVAAGAVLTKNELNKEAKAAEEVKVKEEAAELAKTGVDLTEKEFAVNEEVKAAEKEVADTEELLNNVLPDASGRYREKGKFISKEKGDERKANTELELSKRKEALDNVLKKQKAIVTQRNEWKKKIGGIK